MTASPEETETAGARLAALLARGDVVAVAGPLGITRVHGQPQEVVLGSSRVVLYPLFHPAAALYTPRMLDVLETDFGRLPDLLVLSTPSPGPEAVLAATPPAAAEPVQLGLF